MTSQPAYIRHSVAESDVTVDWFFGNASVALKARQLALVGISWFFALLPVALTAWALIHRHDPDSLWARYSDWYATWQTMMTIVVALIAFFAVTFLAMFLLNRAAMRKRNLRNTFHEHRLERRLAVSAEWYEEKYGDMQARTAESRVVVLPGGNIGTFELRELYAKNDVA
ncbi:hypothetical protein [Demequina aurantiaca]|uniref:hypothetical protein n=1 Tax=Demequina aurantiaca TaxID=676200 RepID=UPI000784D050|nr:hypothetical protein [Demequina aurantiaca]